MNKNVPIQDIINKLTNGEYTTALVKGDVSGKCEKTPFFPYAGFSGFCYIRSANNYKEVYYTLVIYKNQPTCICPGVTDLFKQVSYPIKANEDLGDLWKQISVIETGKREPFSKIIKNINDGSYTVGIKKSTWGERICLIRSANNFSDVKYTLYVSHDGTTMRLHRGMPKGPEMKLSKARLASLSSLILQSKQTQK